MIIIQKGITTRTQIDTIAGFSHYYSIRGYFYKRSSIAQQYKIKLFKTLNLPV